MRSSTIRNIFLSLLSVLALVVAGGLLVPATAVAGPDASISLEIYKAGFILGGSGGSGTLHYKGKSYAVEVGGISVGATIGVSKAELLGHVYNLKHLSDIEGTYSATTAGLAIAGGEKVAELKNSRGVELKVQGKQIGLELSLDLSGIQITLKKK